MTVKSTQVKLELPRDIIFAMRGLKGIEEIKEKLKTSLAIILFQDKTISLGKATKLAGMSRVKFLELLKRYDLPAYVYTEEDYEKDRQAAVEYLGVSKA